MSWKSEIEERFERIERSIVWRDLESRLSKLEQRRIGNPNYCQACGQPAVWGQGDEFGMRVGYCRKHWPKPDKIDDKACGPIDYFEARFRYESSKLEQGKPKDFMMRLKCAECGYIFKEGDSLKCPNGCKAQPKTDEPDKPEKRCRITNCSSPPTCQYRGYRFCEEHGYVLIPKAVRDNICKYPINPKPDPEPPLYVRVEIALGNEVILRQNGQWAFKRKSMNQVDVIYVRDRTKSIELAIQALEEYCRKHDLIGTIDLLPYLGNPYYHWQVKISNEKRIFNSDCSLAICEAIDQHHRAGKCNCEDHFGKDVLAKLRGRSSEIHPNPDCPMRRAK